MLFFFSRKRNTCVSKLLLGCLLCVGISSCSAENSAENTTPEPKSVVESDQNSTAVVSASVSAQESSETQSMPSTESTDVVATEEALMDSQSSQVAVKLASDQPRFVEGQHYRRLQGVPKYEATDKVLVQEFFSYGCPHCFRLEPLLAQWYGKGNPAMAFERVPATWNTYFKSLAQAYYTMQILGVGETLHGEIFNAIHLRRETLKSEAALQALFAKADVSEEDFKKTFNSFAVQQKVNTAQKLFQTYKLDHVPMFVIGNQYVTDVSMVGGNTQDLFNVIDFLVRKIKIDSKS